MGLINRSLKIAYYSLFVATPLIMSSKTSELFEFNKMLFIYFIASLVVFLWVLKMVFSRKIIIKSTPFDIPIFLFFLSQVLSTFFSIDRQTSIFGYYSRFNGGLLSIIAYLILFYGFVSNFNLSFSLNLLKASLWSSFLVVVWGLPGKAGYDLSCGLFAGQLNNNCWTDQFRPSERMFSTLGQPNWLGAYLAIHFFIALFFFLKEHKNKIVYFTTFFYLVLNFISILFTRSRSAFAAVVFGLIIYILISLRSFSKKTLLLVFSLIVVIAIVKTGIPRIDRYFDPATYMKKVLPAGQMNVSAGLKESNITESFDIRKIVWEGAIRLGKRYPLFGTGVETFAYSYYFVRPKEHNLTSEWDFLYNKAHNEYLNYWATTGFIGVGTHIFFIFFFLFWSAKILLTNKDRSFLLLAKCLLLGWFTALITNFFGFSTTTINLFFYLIPAFLFSFFIASDSSHKEVGLRPSASGYFVLFANSIFFVVAIVYLGGYLVADMRYAEATNYSKIGEYQKAAQYLDTAMKLKNEHVYADKLSYVLANLAFVASYQKQQETSSKLISLANYYNDISLKSSPKNILYWKTKAKNHYLFYQITLDDREMEEAINALLSAREIAPTDPKIPYNLAIFYSLLADSDKQRKNKLQIERQSIWEINQAIALKNNYRDAYFLEAQLLKKYGDSKKAKEALEYILKRLNPRDEEAKKELQEL